MLTRQVEVNWETGEMTIAVTLPREAVVGMRARIDAGKRTPRSDPERVGQINLNIGLGFPIEILDPDLGAQVLGPEYFSPMGGVVPEDLWAWKPPLVFTPPAPKLILPGVE